MSEDTIDYKKLAEALAEALEQRNLWIEGEEYRELVILRMRLSNKVESLAEELEAADARIAELEEAQRWIPVSERLPEDRVTILAAFNNREILTAKYYKYYEGFGSVENYWRIEGWHSGNVTHWMPLPQPPEVQQ